MTAGMKKKALAMAVLTTALWSGSYIFNKLAFQQGIGPLTLSGLRYLLASLLLSVPDIGKKQADGQAPPFKAVILLGLLGYAAAQGLQYMGQSYLTPTQSSLFLAAGNTTCVLLVDRFWLRENQGWRDLGGMLLMILGIILYYFPFDGAGFSAAGTLFMVLSSVGYALNLTFNRSLLKSSRVAPRLLAARPMLFGSLVMLAFGLSLEGLPVITGRLLLILLYLSAVSGALGFFLWTKSQAHLSAFESSSVNNLMLIETALLDLLVFGRHFSLVQAAAILTVFISVVWIQLKRRNPGAAKTERAGRRRTDGLP